MRDLVNNFGISEPTIIRDLDFIERQKNIPLERKAGNGGYIRISSEWNRNTVHYDEDEEESTIEACLTCTNPKLQKKLAIMAIKHGNPLHIKRNRELLKDIIFRE